MNTAESMMFSISPLCPLAADVLCDGKSIYFYLYDLNYDNECLGVRTTCWVKNLIEAPKAFPQTITCQPVMPAQYIASDMDMTAWNEDDIDIIWSKEGHIAFLYYQDMLYSVLPSWADGKNFPGYSHYMIENNTYAWGLNDAYDVLIKRMNKGKTFWSQEFNAVWQAYHTPYVAELIKQYGDIKNVYDLHKDTFPSRLLAVFEDVDNVYAFTIGCGIFCMPNADTFYQDYEHHDRCELAITLPKTLYQEEERIKIFHLISDVCEIPWRQISFLTHGHSLEMKVGVFDYSILVDDDACHNHLALSIKQDHVHLLWIEPVDTQTYTAFQDKEKRHLVMSDIIEKRRMKNA